MKHLSRHPLRARGGRGRQKDQVLGPGELLRQFGPEIVRGRESLQVDKDPRRAPPIPDPPDALELTLEVMRKSSVWQRGM